MDWLRKHWKGAAYGLAGIVGTTIVGKIVDHYSDASIFATLWGLLVSCWALATTSVPIPLWLLTALVTAVLMYAIAIVKQLRTSSAKLRLSEDQQFVLHGVGVLNTQHAHEPTLDQISEMCGLTLSVTERITDQLRTKGLMRWKLEFVRGNWDVDSRYEHIAQMTKAGRDYLLDMDIDPSNPDHNQ